MIAEYITSSHTSSMIDFTDINTIASILLLARKNGNYHVSNNVLKAYAHIITTALNNM